METTQLSTVNEFVYTQHEITSVIRIKEESCPLEKHKPKRHG